MTKGGKGRSGERKDEPNTAALGWHRVPPRPFFLQSGGGGGRKKNGSGMRGSWTFLFFFFSRRARRGREEEGRSPQVPLVFFPLPSRLIVRFFFSF